MSNHRQHNGLWRCPHCGQRTVEYRHTLSRGLVTTLDMFTKICPPGEARHPKEFTDDYSRRCNWYKLPYWGFILPAEESGCFTVGHRGYDFVNPDILLDLPYAVWTYNGKVVEFEADGWVNMYDVISRDDPYWQTEF